MINEEVVVFELVDQQGVSVVLLVRALSYAQHLVLQRWLALVHLLQYHVVLAFG